MKQELINKIRKLQVEEGNQPCFKTKLSCPNMEICCWAELCLYVKPVCHLFKVVN